MSHEYSSQTTNQPPYATQAVQIRVCTVPYSMYIKFVCFQGSHKKLCKIKAMLENRCGESINLKERQQRQLCSNYLQSKIIELVGNRSRTFLSTKNPFGNPSITQPRTFRQPMFFIVLVISDCAQQSVRVELPSLLRKTNESASQIFVLIVALCHCSVLPLPLSSFQTLFITNRQRYFKKCKGKKILPAITSLNRSSTARTIRRDGGYMVEPVMNQVFYQSVLNILNFPIR